MKFCDPSFEITLKFTGLAYLLVTLISRFLGLSPDRPLKFGYLLD